MKTKRIVFGLIIFTLIFTLLLKNTKNIKANELINKEPDIDLLSTVTGSMSVSFTEDGKTTVNLTESTVYNGWNYNNIGRLNITLSELDIDIVYKLVIKMDSTLYLPVDVLPCPAGATASFEKNDPISVNGNQTYEGQPFSGTITYTFNSESSKTVAIDNFELEFKYDEILWNNLANDSLKSGSAPVLSVQLIVEEEVLDEKNFLDITTEVAGQHSFNAGFRYGNNINENSFEARYDDLITFSIGNNSSYFHTGQYYKQLNIELDIPCYSDGDSKYYLKYDVNDIKVFIKSGVALDKSYYNLVATEDKILIQLNDFYTTTSSLLNIPFTFPQDTKLINNENYYPFKGEVKTYVDGDPNLSIYSSAEKFIITLNTKEESKLTLHSASWSVYYDNKEYVQPFGGVSVGNSGGDSGRIKLIYDFDVNYTDDDALFVTTMRLPIDNVTSVFEVKYSLIDENGNLVYFDSSGNIVPEGTPGALKYWTANVTNPFKGKVLYYYNSILFNRSNIRNDHRQYYFKSIEHVLGCVESGFKAWHSGAPVSNSASSGTYWGYAKFKNSSSTATTNVKIFEEDGAGNFNLKFEKNQITSSTNNNAVAYGMTNGKVSTNIVDAGNSFTISGRVSTLSYPYSANNILNTVDNNIILGFKLPEGVTINSAGSSFTNSSGTVKINIKNITSKPLGDGNNLWIIELEGGESIGYYSESLGAISNGSYIKFDVAFNTSLATSGTTLYVKNISYAASADTHNSASGTYGDMSVIDEFDLNGNGSSSDKVGCFRAEFNSLTIQIVGKNATLDITDNAHINNVLLEQLDNNLEKYDDIISYELEINCTSGGKAEDFEYYIPIVKKTSIVDNELIFNATYSLKLNNVVTVINSISENGVKILYSFDTNITYSTVNVSTWYETIPFEKTVEEVTMIKIVSQSGTIENGSVSIVRLSMSYEGEELDYSSDAGMYNSWTSRGQYKYLIGDRGVAGHYSTDINNLNINYTFDQQVIELTTSPGNHTDDIGNDSKVIEILTTFKNVQTFKISNITTYNAIITDVLNMETNAHLLTGDEANRTFAFYTTLDSNTKQDIAQINPILGTVSSLSTFKLNFEIFNADVISDITTIRYIDITIESENGVTIPVRINIKRELTVIGTVSNSISSGKQYTLFGTTETQITISKDSAFTAQFSAENIIPNNYKGRKLVFTNTLPVNSTIVLIDLTNTNNVKYYMYEITSSDTNTIDLTKFNVMGKETKYTVTTGLEAITEKLLFIIDLPDDNTLLDGTLNSINLARTLNSNIDEMSPEGLKFTTKDIREYELKATDNTKLGEEIIVEYEISEIDYSDSKYNDRKLSLSIIPTSTNSIYDSSIEYNGNTYYLNSNNEFIIPLSDVQTSGKYSIKFIYNSSTIKYNEGTCDLNIKLIASATSSAEKPHLGQTLKEVNINLTTSKKSSLKVESMSDRVIKNDELKDIVEVKYNALNVTGKVTLELQEKIGEGYTTDSTLLEAVNGITTQISGKFTVTGVYTLNLKFSQLMPSGNYQILFTVYDSLGNVERTVTYKFVVVNE